MGRSLPSQPPPEPLHRARRRYRFHRRHTPHYYLVAAGLTGAALVCVLNVVAFLTQRVDLATAAFVLVTITAITLYLAYFWGIFMVSSGHIPARRVMVVHGMVGTLAPLFYTININAAIDGVGMRPLSGVSLVVGFAGLAMLVGQVLLGRAVVRPEPLRIIRREDT